MLNNLKTYFYILPVKYIVEFKKDKFKHNNFRILLVSSILIIVELYSALFITIPNTKLQFLTFITALIMFIYTIISIYFYKVKPAKIRLVHKIYQLSIAFIGITIAIIRIAIYPYFIMNLPAIFFAVIYGLAVIFYYSFLESFIIYIYGVILLYYVAIKYQPILLQGDVFLNATTNIIIAWIASMVIFKKYLSEFSKQKKIEYKNIELNEINEKLKILSIKDELTGLYNRRKLEELLQDEYQKAKRYNHVFSVVLLDLDDFKKINDNYGHQVGDQVLKEVSKILLDTIRKVDYCGRWGGEEFLILLPDTKLDAAVTLAQRVRKEIEGYSIPKVDNLTSSFGVSVYSPGKEIKDIIKEADEALYRAKEKGKNNVQSKN